VHPSPPGWEGAGEKAAAEKNRTRTTYSANRENDLRNF
jgi:hypothetical protein